MPTNVKRSKTCLGETWAGETLVRNDWLPLGCMQKIYSPLRVPWNVTYTPTKNVG